MITGFRLAPGGRGSSTGHPDVSVYGKIAGGGLPFGALGGSAEAMRLLEFDREPGAIFMAGTFNGNPMVTAAGTAVLRRLKEEPGIYARINAMGERFRAEINRFAEEEVYGATAVGAGSMFWYASCRDRSKRPRCDRGTHSQGGLRLLLQERVHIRPITGYVRGAHGETSPLIEVTNPRCRVAGARRVVEQRGVDEGVRRRESVDRSLRGCINPEALDHVRMYLRTWLVSIPPTWPRPLPVVLHPLITLRAPVFIFWEARPPFSMDPTGTARGSLAINVSAAPVPVFLVWWSSTSAGRSTYLQLRLLQVIWAIAQHGVLPNSSICRSGRSSRSA